MKSRWLVLVMAAFLVFLGSPAGVWACQKAMNTAAAERDDMGLSSSGSEYNYNNEEMSPASPEGWDQLGKDDVGRDDMTPSSPGLDESRDDMNSDNPGTDEHRDEVTPSSPGTDEQRDEMTPSSPGTDDSRDEMGSSSSDYEWQDELAPSSPQDFTNHDELTPSGSASDFGGRSDQGTPDQNSDIYYP